MIKSRADLATLCQQLKQENKKIGFTSGTFDLLHGGHLTYLKRSKKICDVLIVGINSDASVKAYKSPKRPIISESQRVALIDCLKVVDYSFIFNEKNNHQNIKMLKPDFYLKAGDYSLSTLSSAPLVKSYGGEVKLISFKEGFSTTHIIEKILSLYNSPTHGEPSIDKKESVHPIKNESKTNIIMPATPIPNTPKPTVFLDRDGTINEEIEYLHQKEKFKLLPGVLEGIKKLQKLGYRIAVVTTQAGIGLGYFTEEDFYELNKVFLKACHGQGIIINKIYYCPHSKSDNCNCRKPATGLFKRASRDIPSDLSRSIMIGDKTSDIQAGKNAGLYTILVKTGHGGKDLEYTVKPDYVAKDLLDAANHIDSNKGKDFTNGETT